MTFKLNQLELTPDYDAYKNFSITFGKDYQYVPITGAPPVGAVSSVNTDKVSISFPLAREAASTGVTLQNQVRELVKNPDVPFVYLNWSAATHLNGYYGLDDAAIKLPEGGVSGGFAEFSARLTKVGEDGNSQPALQLNKASRSHAYGTMITAQSLHGFPCETSVFSKSGTFYARSGSNGTVAVVQNAGSQDIFPYEQDASNIGAGDVRVYDTNTASTVGTVRADWVEVLGPDHRFIGDVVLENSILQARTRKGFGTDQDPGAFNLYFWNATAWDSARRCSFAENGGVDHGTTSPHIAANKISPEQSEIVLTYPPAANSLKLKVRLQRGRCDLLTKPDVITGSVHGSLHAQMYWVPGYATVQADATASCGTTAGEYAIAMASKNFLVAYDTASAYHQGIAKVGTRTFNSTFIVSSSKVTTLKVATGTDWTSFFVVNSPGTINDTPSDLGAQLLMDTKAIPKVARR